MILLFGSTGQLGSRLQALIVRHKMPLTVLTRQECDFAKISLPELQQLLKPRAPTMVINAAAWTAVDEAEKKSDEALRVNAIVPGWLAQFTKHRGIPLVHFSTDYVFDGAGGAPYGEDAKPNPVNRYGRSKFEGEQMVMQANPSTYLFRMQWLYDVTGKNFLRSMIELMKEREVLRVVADQVGAPTTAADTAYAVFNAIPKILKEKTMKPGIYHLAAGGYTSWHGFACAIADEMLARGMPCATKVIEPITGAEYGAPAIRPKDARLATAKLAAVNLRLPHWRDGLNTLMEEVHAGH